VSHGHIRVTKDKEQEAPKHELGSPTTSSLRQHPLGEEEPLAPSSSVRRTRWFTQTLRDVQEYIEAPRSTFGESIPPKKFLNYMELMSSVTDSEPSNYQEATD
jgi:hypothetical protein